MVDENPKPVTNIDTLLVDGHGLVRGADICRVLDEFETRDVRVNTIELLVPTANDYQLAKDGVLQFPFKEGDGPDMTAKSFSYFRSMVADFSGSADFLAEIWLED